MAKKKNYVTNAELKSQLKLYDESKVIPEKLHFMFYEMSTRIGRKPNFINYTYISDMIQEAYAKCISIVHKFDQTRENPYGYFTTVIHNCFLDYIGKEKRLNVTREKLRDDFYADMCNRVTNMDERMLFEEGENNEY